MRLDERRTRRARERLGYSAADTAQVAGIATNSVLRAEHGEDIRPVTARKLASGLGVRVADLISGGAELSGKAAPRQWSGLSEEEKQARRHEHDWTRILSGAFERILEEEQKHINEDWTTYPDPERVRETYSLLNQFEKAGGTQGSKRLEELMGLIQRVLTSIDRMDLHKDDPVTTKEERHLGIFSNPSLEERAFPQAEEAN